MSEIWQSESGLFEGPYRIGQENVVLKLTYPTDPGGKTMVAIQASGQEEEFGLYPTVEVDKNKPDDYSREATPEPFTLAVNGPEYTAGTTITKTYQWQSWSADEIRDDKDADARRHANDVAFSSAQTNENENVFILTDELNLFFYLIVGAFYADRHKDRTLGKDSTDGYDPTPPQNDPPTTDYWARNVPVYLINAQNDNELERNAVEVEWGQTLKDIGMHVLEVRQALRNFRDELAIRHAAYVADPSEANRTALISLDPEDPSFGWPPYYVPQQ